MKLFIKSYVKTQFNLKNRFTWIKIYIKDMDWE